MLQLSSLICPDCITGIMVQFKDRFMPETGLRYAERQTSSA